MYILLVAAAGGALAVFQFIVVFGVHGNILPVEDSAVLQGVLWKIIEFYDMCVCYDGHTRNTLAVIRTKAQAMMVLFKDVFGEYSASNCSFPKFHYTLHLLRAIMEWGSLRAIDTAFGEVKQSDVRNAFTQTSRRHGNIHRELTMVTARARVTRNRAQRYGGLFLFLLLGYFLLILISLYLCCRYQFEVHAWDPPCLRQPSRSPVSV